MSRRIFIPVTEPDGKVKRVPVKHRALYLDSDIAQVESQHYKLTRTKRGGEFTHSVYMVPKARTAKWLELKLKPEEQDQEYRRVQGGMDECQALAWLTHWVGEWRAVRLMERLKNC